MASRFRASVKRIPILALKIVLCVERVYSSSIHLPAQGAVSNLLSSLGLLSSTRPAFSFHPVSTPPSPSGKHIHDAAK